ncbi:uncharacterized protein LOC127703040 isoform X5 [Mytilus californianus]|nr:uncharacterized protein LOC127703040 isoform X5 [Mytilus californianus]XP_052063388.1 uncharacterized protein LOC127703040 isoform X5 [Mytilus californianus]
MDALDNKIKDFSKAMQTSNANINKLNAKIKMNAKRRKIVSAGKYKARRWLMARRTKEYKRLNHVVNTLIKQITKLKHKQTKTEELTANYKNLLEEVKGLKDKLGKTTKTPVVKIFNPKQKVTEKVRPKVTKVPKVKPSRVKIIKNIRPKVTIKPTVTIKPKVELKPKVKKIKKVKTNKPIVKNQKKITKQVKKIKKNMSKEKKINKEMPKVTNISKVMPKVKKIKKVMPKVTKITKIMPKVKKIKKVMPKVTKITKIMPKVKKIKKVMPKVTKVKKIMPKVEKTTKIMPKVKKVKTIMPKVKKVKTVKPKVTKTTKIMPKVKKVKIVKPKVEKTTKIMSKVKKVKTVKPKVTKTTKIMPKVKKVKTVKPKVETTTKIMPKVKKIKIVKPKVEKTTKIMPKVKKIKIVKPKVTKTTKIMPKVKKVKTVKPKVTKTTKIMPKVKKVKTVKPKVTKTTKIMPKVKKIKTVKPKVKKVKTVKPKVKKVKIVNPKVEKTTKIMPKAKNVKTVKSKVEKTTKIMPKEKKVKIVKPKVKKVKTVKPKVTKTTKIMAKAYKHKKMIFIPKVKKTTKMMPKGYNYALGKKAAQSSTWHSKYAASKAVDGKENTFTHTKNEKNAYWSVDLGKTINVKQINIINRNNCCGNRLKNIAVTVGQNRHQMKLCSNFKGPGKTGQVIMLTCKSPISGRHVKLLRSGKGYLSLAEVQVIGHTGENIKPKPEEENKNPKPEGYNYALGKKAAQSSTAHSKYAASKAVDGKESTFTHTKNENNAYWSVDLGKTVNVTQINIINRKNCCGNRLKNIAVTVGQNRHQMKLCSNFKGPGKTGQEIMLTCKSPMSGRHVKILRSGKGYLSLAEVQVIGHTGENIKPKPEEENNKPKPEGYNYALGKKAAQSSTAHSKYAASKAVDGKESTFTHTKNENNAYWSVDLGKTVNVTQINIINRKNCCGNRLKNIAVTVGQNRHQMKLCSNFKGPGKTGQEIMLTCKSPMSGRHVKILRSGKGYLSLAEVQVIGHTGENEKQPVKPEGGNKKPVKPEGENKKLKAEGYNYALGKKAAQSSTLHSKYAASKAVDGNENTFTLTRHGNDAYWSVDLGKTVNVKQINIINRKKCCGNRLRNIAVRVGQNRHQMKLCSNFKGPGKAGQVIMLTCKSPISGRHVKLLRSGKGYLSLAEVQVIGHTGENEKRPTKPEGGNKKPVKPEGYNYALGKKAAQSSTWHSKYAASKAVDGKKSTFTHTKNENNAYWSVDLGKTVNVKQINIINRQDCCGYRLKNIAVTVGQNPHGMKLCNNFKGPGKTRQVIMITCKRPISGRHVKLLRRGKGFLTLAEVQVIGDTGEIKKPVKPEGTSKKRPTARVKKHVSV